MMKNYFKRFGSIGAFFNYLAIILKRI